MKTTNQRVEEVFLSPKQIGERLNMKQAATLALLKPGKIWPVLRINERVLRVPASSLERFIEERTWAPAPISKAAGE